MRLMLLSPACSGPPGADDAALVGQPCAPSVSDMIEDTAEVLAKQTEALGPKLRT